MNSSSDSQRSTPTGTGPRRKLALVEFPRCALCGSFDCFVCPVCDTFFCGDCTIRITENTCAHQKYIAPNLERW